MPAAIAAREGASLRRTPRGSQRVVTGPRSVVANQLTAAGLTPTHHASDRSDVCTRGT